MNIKRDYYTHELPSEKTYKVVLKGLHKMEINELLSELQAAHITPLQIKPITSDNPNNDYCIYILSFQKKITDLKQLRQTKCLFHTIIKWESYRPRRTGPIQCNRCNRYGHGEKNCNMPYRCKYCAENHNSQNCPKLANNEQNNMALVKCCNCDGNHLASDASCPRRAQYSDSRRKLANEGRTNKIRNFQLINHDFPQLPGNQEKTHTQMNVGPQTKLFSSIIHSSGDQQNLPSFTFPNFNSSQKNNSPFSCEEIISLTSDILNHLQNFNSISREEVIVSVMQISLKYLFNHGS